MHQLRSACGLTRPKDQRDIVIYRNDEYTSNWPMTGGMWIFPDGEVAVGFTRLKLNNDPANLDHIRLDTWGELCLVRSRDGGDTWDMDRVEVVVRKRETAIAYFQEGAVGRNCHPVDFASPDTVLMSNYIGEHLWARDYKDARFWTMILASPDRGKTWPLGPLFKKPPHMFSSWGLPSTVVRPDGSTLLFSDCVLKGNEAENLMHIYADLLEAGGTQWTYHGLLDLERRDAKHVIHPAPVSLGDSSILLAARCQTPPGVVFVMLYRSDDYGRNWYTVGRVTDVGGTPHLLKLRDGRLVLTYERRWPPYGIRARVSEDPDGYRWGPEIVLRDDGGDADLGYSRSVERADGTVLTAFYFNRAGESINGFRVGGLRHIAGALWNPDNI